MSAGAPGPAPGATVPAPPLSQSLRLVATLTIAGLLSGLVLVAAYLATLPRIQANQAEAMRLAVFRVVPGAASMRAMTWDGSALVASADGATGGEGVFAVWDEAGTFAGWAVPGEGSGFQDTIKLLFGYRSDRARVVGLQVLESRETPGLGDKIFKDADFVAGFSDLAPAPEVVVVKKGTRSAPNEIDGITGATISSKAVAKIVTATSARWVPRLPEPPPPGVSAPAAASTGPSGGEANR